MRRTILRTVIALLLTATAGLVTSAQADAATTRCHPTWGSLPRAVEGAPQAEVTVTGVRVGRHTCYERVVVDVAGKVTEWSASYPAGPHRTELMVNLAWRPAVDQYPFVPGSYYQFQPTVRGFSAITGVTSTNDTHLHALYIGTRAQLPYRVFVLDGPGAGSRLVVDIAKHW